MTTSVEVWLWNGISWDVSDRKCLVPCKRQTTWGTLLKAHWEVLAAIDFTTVEVWTKSGLVTFYLLFVIELKTRRVHFAGCTTSPHKAWMKQIARNLTYDHDGFLLEKRKLIMDHDSTFCESFRTILKQSDIKWIGLPPRSPNLNAYIKRFSITQIRVSEQYDFLWRDLVKKCGQRIPDSLSRRTKSPGARSSDHWTGRGSWPKLWWDWVPRRTRCPAKLLLSQSGVVILITSFCFFCNHGMRTPVKSGTNGFLCY